MDISFARKYENILGYSTRFFKSCFQNKESINYVNFLKNKLPDPVTNPYNDKIVKTEPIEKIIFPSQKRK